MLCADTSRIHGASSEYSVGPIGPFFFALRHCPVPETTSLLPGRDGSNSRTTKQSTGEHLACGKLTEKTC